METLITGQKRCFEPVPVLLRKDSRGNDEDDVSTSLGGLDADSPPPTKRQKLQTQRIQTVIPGLANDKDTDDNKDKADNIETKSKSKSKTKTKTNTNTNEIVQPQMVTLTVKNTNSDESSTAEFSVQKLQQFPYFKASLSERWQKNNKNNDDKTAIVELPKGMVFDCDTLKVMLAVMDSKREHPRGYERCVTIPQTFECTFDNLLKLLSCDEYLLSMVINISVLSLFILSQKPGISHKQLREMQQKCNDKRNIGKINTGWNNPHKHRWSWRDMNDTDSTSSAQDVDVVEDKRLEMLGATIDCVMHTLTREYCCDFNNSCLDDAPEELTWSQSSGTTIKKFNEKFTIEFKRFSKPSSKSKSKIKPIIRPIIVITNINQNRNNNSNNNTNRNVKRLEIIPQFIADECEKFWHHMKKMEFVNDSTKLKKKLDSIVVKLIEFVEESENNNVNVWFMGTHKQFNCLQKIVLDYLCHFLKQKRTGSRLSRSYFIDRDDDDATDHDHTGKCKVLQRKNERYGPTSPNYSPTSPNYNSNGPQYSWSALDSTSISGNGNSNSLYWNYGTMNRIRTGQWSNSSLSNCMYDPRSNNFCYKTFVIKGLRSLFLLTLKNKMVYESCYVWYKNIIEHFVDESMFRQILLFFCNISQEYCNLCKNENAQETLTQWFDLIIFIIEQCGFSSELILHDYQCIETWFVLLSKYKKEWIFKQFIPQLNTKCRYKFVSQMAKIISNNYGKNEFDSCFIKFVSDELDLKWMLESELPHNDNDKREFVEASRNRMSSCAKSKSGSSTSQQVESQIL